MFDSREEGLISREINDQNSIVNFFVAAGNTARVYQ